MSDSDDYNESVVMVDPNDIEIPSDQDEPDEDELTIDCDFELNRDGYDPMSLVSVGLEDDEDEEDEVKDVVESNEEACCSFCPLKFESKKSLSVHIKTEHSKSCCVACQYCGRVLSDADSYRRHLNNVHQMKLTSTETSPDSKAVQSSPSKASKKVRAAPAPMFSLPSNVRKCPDCDQQFATKTTLNIHRLKVHVAELKNLPCPQCHMEVPDLTSHMRRFHNVDGIVCPHCANIFSKKCTLNRHIEQVHLNIQIHKPATCPECHKVFSKKGHLDRHIKIIHQGIKDYSDPCPYCGKVFTTRASLEPHIAMVHEGVRKKCSICNKVLSDLNKHMRTVHGTYRRKAKIPKELISEIDNPDSSILPQIYGTSSKSSPVKTENIPSPSPVVLQSIPQQQKIPKRKLTPQKSKNFELQHDMVTESIKEELGLSSGITLQKIVRTTPVKAPPKLTYHGPVSGTNPKLNEFGSIEITPMAHLEEDSDTNNCNIPSLLNMEDIDSQPSKMIKISGKFSRQMPGLSKVVQKS